MKKSIKITFITPCFCRGASDFPEIRSSSIRGQLRWWFRLLYADPQEENAIFGNIHSKSSQVSKIIVRTRYLEAPEVINIATLPHKQGGHSAIKQAISPGTTFELIIFTRLGGLSSNLQEKLKKTLAAWLHLGSLGLRSTRGGGNFTWEEQANNISDYMTGVNELGLDTYLLEKKFSNAEAARKVICNTLADSAFNNKAPLGKFGRERKTSPLRFRIIKLTDQDFRIIAIWDHRDEITRNTEDDLQVAAQILKSSSKEIGTLLMNALNEA